MKYAVSQYAEALVESLEGHTDKERKRLVRNFLSLLRTHRASSQLPRILGQAEAYILKKQGLKKVCIESPSPLSRATVHEIKKILGQNIVIEESSNPRLLAGINILVDNETLIDATGKTQLEKMLT